MLVQRTKDQFMSIRDLNTSYIEKNLYKKYRSGFFDPKKYLIV